MQVDAEEVAEYPPKGHTEQASDPVAALKVPGAHAEQFPPSGPQYPRSQTQLTLPAVELEFDAHARHSKLVEAATEVEYVPTMHREQCSVPLLSLNLPRGHAEQFFEYPAARQKQSSAATVPDDVVAGPGPVHNMQWLAALIFEYFPDSQAWQGEAPLWLVYFPGLHALHGIMPPSPVYPGKQVHVVLAVRLESASAGHGRQACDPISDL